MRRRGIEPIDIREQHQEVGSRHRRDTGGQPVVVAIADFRCGDRVVFIDDRHGADLAR